MDWINVRPDEEMYGRREDLPTPPLSQDADTDEADKMVEPGPHNEPGTAPKNQTNKHPHGQPEIQVTHDFQAVDEPKQTQTPPSLQSTTTASSEEADRQAAVAILLRRQLKTDTDSGMGTPEIVPISPAQVDANGQLKGNSSFEQLQSLGGGIVPISLPHFLSTSQFAL